MKRCFMCSEIGDVCNFDESKFEDCYLKILFRKEKKFKHGDLQFDVAIANEKGYHRDCLKKITVLKSKHKDAYEAFFVSQPIPHFSTIPSNPGPSTSSATRIESSISELPDTNMETHGITSEKVIGSSPSLEESPMEIEEASDVRCDDNSVTVPEKKSACIFCGSYSKRSGKKQTHVIYSQNQSTINNILQAAQTLNDIRLQSKIEGQNSVAYHSVCFSTYLVKFKRQSTDRVDDDGWHNNRDLHKKAFKKIIVFIEEKIIKMKKVLYLTQLLSRYKALLVEFGEGKVCLEDFESYRAEHLEKKILTVLGDQLFIIASTGPLRKKIVYGNDIDISMLATETVNLETKSSEKFEDDAYDLRNCVKTLQRDKLPNKLRADDIIKGECDIPKLLYDFISNLIEGPDVNSKNNNDKSVKVTSLCSDIIYAVTNGRVKGKGQDQ
ncbi:uncharacterized protein LOC141530711 [Cotesia typhae]|uniref:uncharacterized protein LOC141530711 n=1 Tax=Cotesia typhae TaxID=2053667 RepID=UPI003D695EC0